MEHYKYITPGAKHGQSSGHRLYLTCVCMTKNYMKKPEVHFTFNGYYLLVQPYKLRKKKEISSMQSSDKNKQNLSTSSYRPMQQKDYPIASILSNTEHNCDISEHSVGPFLQKALITLAKILLSKTNPFIWISSNSFNASRVFPLLTNQYVKWATGSVG